MNHWLLMTWILALGSVLLRSLPAAEPEPDPSELPRIPATESQDALGTFEVRPGFHLDLVASEPLVVDPIALSFDENGRLFVVEMIGYSERRDEKLGRIRLLEDTNEDGRFDKSTVFADGLAWPTAVICYGGGVFVGVTPDVLFLKDHDGDGVADERKVVFTGFARDVQRLNVQALLNNFQWGPDHRIHGATSFNGGVVQAVGVPNAQPVNLRGRDFSFDPRTLDLRPESGGGQHGLCFDDWGDKFVCSNSRHIQQVMYEDVYAARNPHYAMPAPALDIASDGPAAEVFRISRDEPWRIVRTRWRIGGLVSGPVEGGGRVSGYFTAATGITLYRGHAWPAEYVGDAFIGDAGSNLIHHKRLQPHGVLTEAARPAGEEQKEFVASRDNWFRPVQFANAPDGCLYILDMYREVIEHPWSLPESIKKHLDLNSGHDRGRLYRLAPDGFNQPRLPRLGRASTADLVKTLEHPNGWHRDTASRLLFEREDHAAVAPLKALVESSSSPRAKVHALQALDALDALDVAILIQALGDADEHVRAQAVRWSDRFLARQSSLTGHLSNRLLALAKDPSPRVRYQLAFALGDFQHPKRIEAMATLAKQDLEDAWMQHALLSSLGTGAGDAIGKSRTAAARQVLHRLLGDDSFCQAARGQEFLARLSGLIGAGGNPETIQAWLEEARPVEDITLLQSLLVGLNGGLSRAGSSLAKAGVLAAMTAQFEHVAARARRADLAASERVAALAFLGLGSFPIAEPALASAWQDDQPETVQRGALRALGNFSGSDPARLLVTSWKGLNTALHREALDYLLARPDRIQALWQAIDSGAITTNELTFNQVDSLRHHRDATIRNEAQARWGKPMVTQLDPQAYATALSLEGQAVRGEKIYQDRCATCHRAGQQGHILGPDFATVKAAGQEKILTNIIDPNREVAPNYIQYDLQTRDGESMSGIIASETATSLTLRQANGLETEILRSRIAGMTSQGKSAMPEGLAQGLSHQDLADLLAFVVSQGN